MCAGLLDRNAGWLKRTILLSGVALWVLLPRTSEADTPGLTAQDPWVRQVPGSPVAAAYFTLRNASAQPVTLVGVESPLAREAMIHETQTVHGEAHMRPQGQLVIRPGGTLRFEPGGFHVMLSGFSRALVVGDTVPLSLRFADGSRLQLEARVRPLSP